MPRSDDGHEKVRFEVPNLTQLRKEGLTAVDMHYHTDHSDSRVRVHQVLAKARRAGFGLAITDHNVISGSLHAFQERGDLMIVPGMEVSAFDGPHILTYFYSPGDLEDFFRKHILPNRQGSPWLAIKLGTQEIIDRAESYNCVTIAAHPLWLPALQQGAAEVHRWRVSPAREDEALRWPRGNLRGHDPLTEPQGYEAGRGEEHVFHWGNGRTLAL
jgi:hypothetical protein